MPKFVDFNVEQIDPIAMVGNEAVSRRDLMSPYVWRAANGMFAMLVRAAAYYADYLPSVPITHTYLLEFRPPLEQVTFVLRDRAMGVAFREAARERGMLLV